MTIALLVIACVAPILIIILVLRNTKDMGAQFVAYVITVCATFAGVWLGLFQADVDKRNDEVQQVSSMTGAAMSILGARWTFGQYGAVPFLDQMAANNLISKYFEPPAFKSLVIFNVLIQDPQVKDNAHNQHIVYSNTYYLLCQQRMLLRDGKRKDLRAKIAQINDEAAPEQQMRKEGCFISQPYGSMAP